MVLLLLNSLNKYKYVRYMMCLTPLLFVLVAPAQCQLVAADLFTFVSWQEYEISSVCAAAARPANSAALQVFLLLPLQAALSSCSPPADLLLRAERCTNKHRLTDNGALKSRRKKPPYALMLAGLCSLKTC